MNEEKKLDSVEQTTGTSDVVIDTVPSPNKIGNGGDAEKKVESQPNAEGEKSDESKKYEERYNELEKKLGGQSQELGEYRTFFKNVSPLLDKLNDSPELIQAILDGKINSDLAKEALEGKIGLNEAKEVTEAHKEVKKELGKKEYEKASPADIEKMIAQRVKFEVEAKSKETEGKLKKSIDDVENLRTYEKKVEDFLASIPDYKEYADAMAKFVDEHPEIDDIEIVYNVVKGKVLAEKIKKDEEANAGEAAKGLAANAAGGASQGAAIIEDQNVVDQLIATKGNPNVL